MVPLHLSLGGLKRPKSRPLRFRKLIYRKGADLGHMLLQSTIMKSYMGNTLASLDLTFSDIEKSKSSSLRFEVLHLVEQLN